MTLRAGACAALRTTMPRRIALAVLSEHSLCRHGTADVLRRHGFRVSEYSAPTQLRGAWDAIVVDLDHTTHDTAAIVEPARKLSSCVILMGAAPRLAALIGDFAAVETPEVDVAALAGAARGKSHRPSRELVQLREVWAQLTTRLREVMRLLAEGLGNREIAGALGIGERSVKGYVTKLLVAFEARSRSELALVAYRAGLRPRRRTSL